jgi:hypothetical protein
MRAKAGQGPFLFPGAAGKPQGDIKHFWQAVCRDAKLEGVRLHDLRHCFASILVSSGLSLPVIGRLLGHTQPQTTHRYAHLCDDPLRPPQLISIGFINGDKTPVIPTVAWTGNFECWRLTGEDEDAFRARAHSECRAADPRPVQILIFGDKEISQ